MPSATTPREIHELISELMAAWTANDAERYGRCFTPDATYVSYDGSIRAGREIVASHDDLFRGVLQGSALTGSVESVRPLNDDIFIVYADASVLMPWRKSLPAKRRSRQTIVVVRTAEGWKIAALHNGRIRPVDVPKPGSFPARAAAFMRTILPSYR